MRSQTFSVVLFVLLALSNYSYGQFTSKEYLLTLSDLVSKNGSVEQQGISPLQTLYYVQLLQPGFLWRDLTTMILLGTETEYKNASLFMDHFGKNFVEKIKWYAPEPAKAVVPVKEAVIVPRNEPVKKEPVVDIPMIVSKEFEPTSQLLANASGNKSVKTSTHTKNAVTAGEARAENVLNVPADFERIKASRYIEYGSIGFYHNAAIIHPSYQTEIASLAAHMKEDLTLELVIRGHCNGNAPRTVITAGIMTEFFEINQHDQQKTATAKELTEWRAAYAKRYLIAQGIRSERIQIVGEGGEKMIHPQTSEHAHYNDRVEFEIVKHN
jgi:outer membrane protein OmpA-like peptidoglycan-associated protein